jgi:TRAP-type C4-dicarboxylate transport system permease small subunit
MDVQAGKEAGPPTPSGGLARFNSYLDKVIDPISGVFGATLACVTLAAMMFLTFFDVAGGQLGKLSFINSQTSFFKPILGSQEVTELMMVILVVFALAYCALKKGHIRVDLIMQYTSRKANLWFDIFTYSISAIFYIFLAWQGCLYGLINITDKKVTSVLMIPIYPFNFLLVIGCALAVMVFLRDFLKAIEEVRK